MDKNEHLIKSGLQRISNTLMINGGFLDNPGLYSGDMGIVLFFSRYARFTQNELYSDYSFDLIEKIQQRIDHETPVNYKYGLAGIGSTFEYLAQYGFFEADTDDILDDFDKRIFITQSLSYLPNDEVMGTGYYALWRMSGNSNKRETIQQTILPQIVNVLEDRQMKHNLKQPTVSFFRDIISSENHAPLHDQSVMKVWLQLCRENMPDDLKSKTYFHVLENNSNNDFLTNKGSNSGIQTGLAIRGLSLLTELDGDDSWISLFPNDLKLLIQ